MQGTGHDTPPAYTRKPVIRSLAARCRPVALLAALAASIAAPGLVLAHAELVTATPLPNGSVVEGPRELRIEFSEAIDPLVRVPALGGATWWLGRWARA